MSNKTDMGEDWQFWKEQQRQQDNEKAEYVTRLLADLSCEYPFVCETMQGFIRLHHQHHKFRIDIYPKSGKYHIINTGERGIEYRLPEFIHKHFKP